MRFDGRDHLNETCGVLTHNEFLGLSRLPNPSRTIHSRHNIANFEAQSETTGSELGITG